MISAQQVGNLLRERKGKIAEQEYPRQSQPTMPISSLLASR